jgi:hypothetical protein
MRTRLSSAAYPALAGLATHDVGDPSVALLDAWAVIGDVLSFYQERIANEGYLRTATERRSVLEQARLVGYRPQPGVASSVYLAYTIDQSAAPVIIPKGARVNSVPGPGEQMQAFETSEALEARADWNQLRVRMTQPQTGGSVLDHGLFLKGTATGLKVDDALLVDLGVGRGLEPFRVDGVEPDEAAGRTRVVLGTWDGTDLVRSLVEATVRPLTDLDAYGVPASGATVKRVLAMLGQVSAAASGGRQGVAATLGAILPRLAEVLATAQLGSWTRLLPWLGDVVTRLSGLRRLMAQTAAPPPRRLSRSAARRQDDGGLGGLLERLEAPPSLPPRSSRRLDRSVAATFAASGDIYPALLSTLQPAFQPALYTALGHAEAAPASTVRVVALRQAAALFGANAPVRPPLAPGVPQPPPPWPEWQPAFDEDAKVANLDRVYPGVLPDSPVLVVRPETRAFPRALVLTAVDTVRVVARSAYGLVGRITRLQLDDPWWNPPNDGQTSDEFDQMPVLRASTVYCQSEELELADAPLDDDVCGDEVELERLYDGLRSGRWMIVSGERVDIPGTSGVRACELVMLAGVSQRVKLLESGDDGEPAEPLPGDSLHTFVTFAEPLAYCYRRDSVVLHGNVAHATHGETRGEVLGGGDASQPLQTFTLKQLPLTYTSAPSVAGTASTLEVRVDEVAWHEAANLVTLGPTARSYLTVQDDEGRTSVVFGDGEHGARLPTGQENVRATYRNGIGRPGNVPADQISLLATKPLGVTAVTNPLPATGGADRDGRDQIRRNAPLAVLALDRLVSTQDYADFARTFAGIGKASAARLTDGTRTLVHVTIAGADDIPIDVTSDLHRNLIAALRRFGDPHLPVRVEVRELLALVVSAQVKVLPDDDWELVEPAVRARLLDVFGFDRRELGQDALASEVVAAVQGVRGVDYVDLDVLRAIDEAAVVRQLEATTTTASRPAPPQPGAPRAPGRVQVWPARVVNGVARPAQLAYLQPGVQDSLILNEVPA